MAIRSDRILPVPASAEDLGEPPCAYQEKTLWCWAACIQLAKFIRAGKSPRQCAIVATAFPELGEQRIDCCKDPLDFCNIPAGEDKDSVPRAFNLNGVEAREVKKSTLTLDWIRTVVSKGGQVAVGWKGKASSHMVLVVRASPTEKLLGVCDPWLGINWKTIATLKEPDDIWKGWKVKWVWQIV